MVRYTDVTGPIQGFLALRRAANGPGVFAFSPMRRRSTPMEAANQGCHYQSTLPTVLRLLDNNLVYYASVRFVFLRTKSGGTDMHGDRLSDRLGDHGSAKPLRSIGAAVSL
jgi:hypothetical protein